MVAVIDSGIALNHPDISSNLVVGYDALTGNVGAPYDDQGHGSHVAGVIASLVNNNAGISGISRKNNVKVMPIKASDKGVFSLFALIDAVEHAKNNGADIINMSLGGSAPSEIFEESLRSFPGLIVAAAGNGGDDSVGDDNDVGPIYPASYDLPNIISVAATDQNDNLSTFSNYGNKSVDVGAPGENIYSIEGYRVFFEDFSYVVAPSLGPQLSSSGVNNNWGTYQYPSVTVLWADSNTNYVPSADSYITSNSMDISLTENAYVQIEYFCELGSAGDSLSLQVYNGSVWTLLETYKDGDGGESVVDVSDYASADFRVRFHWVTDLVADGEALGCGIFSIKVVDSSSSQGSFQYMNGTSMSSPYVAAVSAMVWGKNPSISVSELKSIILNSGDPVSSLSGKTVSGRRVNAYKAYTSDVLEEYSDEEISRTVFHPDTRCHWKKPSSPTWMKLEPMEKDGVSGMELTWVQHDANKVSIKIDDGTGNYPWKVHETLNDGHEFLANVQPWQNIMIKPINHCKEGEYSLPVSRNAYPYGWYGTETTNASIARAGIVAGASSAVVLAGSTSSSTTQLSGSNPAPMVPDTGSDAAFFIVISSIVVSFAVYYVTTGKSRRVAIKGFEKRASKDV